jgi:hypothetical protein
MQSSERKKSELQTSRSPMEANHIELTLVSEPTARGVEQGKSKSHRIDPSIRTNSKRNRIRQKNISSPTDAEEEDDNAKEDFNKRVERKDKVLPLAFIAMAPPPVACFLELVVVLKTLKP